MKLSYYGKASKNVWVNFFTFQLLKCLEITRQYSKVWVNLLNSSEMQFYNLAAKIQRDLQMTNSKAFCDMSQRIPVKKIRLLYQEEFTHLSFDKTIIINWHLSSTWGFGNYSNQAEEAFHADRMNFVTWLFLDWW